MSAIKRWVIAVVVLLLGRGRRRRRREDERRIVPRGEANPGSELVVVLLFLAASLFAVGFLVFYALDRLPHQTQLLGAALGLAFLCLSAASILIAKRLVVSEELEEEYSERHPELQAELTELVHESGSRFTRKRLLFAAGGAAGSALGAALVVPALSLGPFLDTGALYETPWRRGLRLVDEHGRPYRADDIEEKLFYTAFPEGADRERISSALVVVRVSPEELDLPTGRRDWAPGGILAFSKICTHAGCAISLYRAPKFAPVEPKPALVCPCHYSTFDPARGGKVIFGPAGRPLPQLPLELGARGRLRAGGNFSGPVGPSWWGVRLQGAR